MSAASLPLIPGASLPASGLLRGDGAMPGFAAALDIAAMSRILDRYLFDGAGSCRKLSLVRFRHRPSKRLIAVYNVDAMTRTGDRARLIVTVRLRPERTAHKSSSNVEERTADGWASVVRVPDLGMTLEVFPRDGRLPHLARYADLRSGVLLSLLQRADIPTGGSRASIELEPIRYRPGLSATFAVVQKQESGELQSPVGYLKVMPSDELRHETAKIDRVNAALIASGAVVRLSRPASEDDIGATIYKPARGVPSEVALQRGLSPVEVAQTAAKALATLHQIGPCGLPDVFNSYVASRIEWAANNIIWACPELAEKVTLATAAATRVIESPVRVPIHCDMKPDHIFVDADRCVELIDSGSVCLGNPVIDLAGLIVRVELAAQAGRIAFVSAERFCSELREAYFTRVPRSWRASEGPALAYTSLLVSTHLIQRLAPDWYQLVNFFVDRAATNFRSGYYDSAASA